MNATMSARLLPALAILVAMLSAPILAELVRPAKDSASAQAQRFDLEDVIPEKFGNWQVDPRAAALHVSPEVQAQLDKIYSQVLARTYTDNRGRRIMLSIAYGGDQSDNLSIHLPEGCYGGQGFAVSPKTTGPLATPIGAIAVARMVATKQSRVEPITYWMVVADKVTTSDWEAKKAKLVYTIRGRIPGGILIRISSISADTEGAYLLQQEFAASLISALPDDVAKRFVGTRP